MDLKFGTDGWRDIIADNFTFANVGRATQAYAEHLLALGQSRVVVGYDTRFSGADFAKRVSEVLASNGLEVLLSGSYLPTPALSFAVKHFGAGGGVMLTASHNPYAYQGFKLKGPYGGSATQAIYQDVAARANCLSTSDVKLSRQKKIEIFDIREAYYRQLSSLIDLNALKNADVSIVHDAMGGAGGGWLKGFIQHAQLGIRVEEVRGRPDPMFYGVNPEPIPQNLESLQNHMTQSDALFATATDGDGDRLGIVLPGGTFFNSNQIFAVMIHWLNHKQQVGDVVKTFTVSRVIERLAASRRLRITETPVGFKYIVDAMLGQNVLVGGEESGGIGVQGHLPERDGIANSLLMLEAVVRTGKNLSEIFAGIEGETGWQHAYDRVDLHLPEEQKQRVKEVLAIQPSTFAGRRIESVETRDGTKLNLSDNAWLLFRASGTEPMLRIYCEAQSHPEVAQILNSARQFALAS